MIDWVGRYAVVGDRTVLTDPDFGVQAICGKFLNSCSLSPFSPTGFPFGMKDSLSASRDRGPSVMVFSGPRE